MVEKKSDKEDAIFKGILRINSKFLGLTLGLLLGLIIFIATIWLVIKGGYISQSGEYVVGPHLQLLSQFFIGYRVSFLGSIIGFLYAFALGSICGSIIGFLYNKIVDWRNR